MEGQNGGGEVPNSPQYTGGGHEVVQAEEIPHDQQNERPAINGQNGTPAQDPRLGQEQPEGPDFLKFCSALSLWAGSLAFGGVMAIESGLVGNQARKNAKELFAWCTFLLSAAFVFALFLLMISRVRPAIPNLHMLAGSVSALLLGCLVASVVLAAVIVMK